MEKIRNQEKVFISIKMVWSMKESLLVDSSKGTVNKFFQMVHLIKGSLLKDRDPEKADFNGQMDKFMMDNGNLIRSMVVVSGKIRRVLLISDNGKKILSQVLES